MRVEFDPAKSEKNQRERGLSFDSVAGFDFDTAIYTVDARRDYGETRWRALGLVGDRLHALVFAEITAGIRVISFRKANRREVKHYEQAPKT